MILKVKKVLCVVFKLKFYEVGDEFMVKFCKDIRIFV